MHITQLSETALPYTSTNNIKPIFSASLRALTLELGVHKMPFSRIWRNTTFYGHTLGSSSPAYTSSH